MREVKFRGKFSKSEDKEWKYGYLTRHRNFKTDEGYYCIQHSDIQSTQVDEDSIGEFTGLKDKNGKEIYEGDIVEVSTNGMNKERLKVNWMIYYWYPFGELYQPTYSGTIIEVIGNIYENPELLKEGEENEQF